MTDRIELDLPPEPERPFNPYEPPRTQQPEAPEPFHSEGPLPVPFEDLRRYPDFLDRLFATIKLGYSDPLGLAERVPATDSLAAPWLFNLLLGLPTGVLHLVLMVMLHSWMKGVPALARYNQEPLVQVLGLVFNLAVGIFIGGTILHLLLWIWGAAREGSGLPQTLRFAGYAQGLFALVGWVPLLGPLLGLGYSILLGLGLARIHGSEAWRSLCAIFLTPILCCCCCFGLMLALR